MSQIDSQQPKIFPVLKASKLHLALVLKLKLCLYLKLTKQLQTDKLQTQQLEMYIINKQLFTYSLHATNFFKAIFKRFGNAKGFAGLSSVCGLVTYKNKHILFLGKNKFDKRGLSV